jgi:hypothetical protein
MAVIRGRPFEPGNQFGQGRPKGSRNKTARVVEELLSEHAEGVVMKCILMARQGNTAAMRLCIERMLPRRFDGPINLKLGSIKTMADVDRASQEIVRAVGNSRITPHEGKTVAKLIEIRRRVIETSELAARVERLEEISQNKNESDDGKSDFSSIRGKPKS